MRALIFAAGRGSRLRPHTDWVPKPLLPVGKYRLWDWQISGLKKAGITDLVVNTAYLADAFEPMPEAYAARGITMKISREGDKETDALETRGGIAKALPLLTDGVTPFVAVAGDVVHDYPMERLNAKAAEIEAGDYDAFMVAVPNPGFHVRGDMTVAADGTVRPARGLIPTAASWWCRPKFSLTSDPLPPNFSPGSGRRRACAPKFGTDSGAISGRPRSTKRFVKKTAQLLFIFLTNDIAFDA